MNQLQCEPIIIFSSEFLVYGDGSKRVIKLNSLSEQGSIFSEGHQWRVEKQGVFSSQWLLIQESEILASAEKDSPFTRSVFFRSAKGTQAKLTPESFWGRTMKLQGVEMRVQIRPNHPFTRQATITGEWLKRDEELLCFGIWFALMLWRRRSSSSS